jgi:hypothetical protein
MLSFRRSMNNLSVENFEIRNEERRVLEFLNSITLDEPRGTEEELPGDMLGDYVARVQTKPLTKIEDLVDVFTSMGFSELAEVFAEDLVTLAYETLATKDIKRLQERLVRFEKRTANRLTYIREPVYTFYRLNEERCRWRYDRELRSFGLLALISGVLHGQQSSAVAMNILSTIDKREDEEGRETFKGGLAELNSLHIAVSGERLGWNMDHPAYKLLLKAFPKAIDMSAYCHGLNAPVLPEGFIENANVTFTTLRDAEGVDLKTDGSGIYNPTCPEMAAFVAKYGAVPCQFRLLQPESGLFAKGTIFPSDKVEGIVLDWTQIKGRWKPEAKQRRADNRVKAVGGCYVGILQAWDRPRRISGSFEMLENIQVNGRTAEVVRNMVDKAMGKLFAKGLDGLVNQIARRDTTIKGIVDFVNVIRSEGHAVSPMDIPRVAEAVKDRLARTLGRTEQGGGGKFRSYVARLDATVPAGHCVVAGMRPGKQVAAFRFPMILPQGLVVMKTIKPKAHHLVNDELPPFQIIMNPADLTIKMQGDDDGDILGVSDSPDILELFSYRNDNDIFHIEPKGVELTAKNGGPLMTNTPEGLEYLRYDHRGPVGRCTVWRSRLLAVGDLNGARALSIAIQECIDRQKRVPEWSNIEKAADPTNWEQREDGWHFTIRYTSDQLEGGEIPMKRLKEWVDGRLIAAGCCAAQDDGKMKALDPLWWRRRGQRVNVDEWFLPPVSEHENLVHIAARHCFKLWEEEEPQFQSKTNIDLNPLLRLVLAAKGVVVPHIVVNHTKYQQGLRAKCGLGKYNDALSSLSANEERRANQVLGAQQKLEEELQLFLAQLPESERITALVEIWEHETSETSESFRPNLNNAFRAVCYPGSPIMEILGIEHTYECQFLHREQRLQRCVDMALKDPDPTQKLTWIVSKSSQHQLEIKDANDQGIPLWDCPDCMAKLTSEVVNTIRTRKASAESQWLSSLTRSLNRT